MKIDQENNFLYLKGAVPGKKSKFLRISDAKGKPFTKIPPLPTSEGQIIDPNNKVLIAETPRPEDFHPNYVPPSPEEHEKMIRELMEETSQKTTMIDPSMLEKEAARAKLLKEREMTNRLKKRKLTAEKMAKRAEKRPSLADNDAEAAKGGDEQ